MKKSKITGWRKVFVFSFLQTVKSKVFILTTVLTAVIMLLVAPLSVEDNSFVNADTGITHIIIKDDTGFKDADYSKLNMVNNNRYESVVVDKSEDDIEDIKDKISTDDEYYYALAVHVTKNEAGYKAEIFKNSEDYIKESDALFFSEDFSEVFEDVKAANAGVSEEQLALIDKEVNTDVVVKSVNETVEGNENTNAKVNPADSSFTFFVPLILFMLLVMCGENIGTSIVTEKSSRVIEYLLTSIKPLALVIGKALAAVLATLIQIAVIIVSSALSMLIGMETGKVNSTSDVFSSLGMDGIIDNMSVFNIVAAVIIMILGFVIFTLIACLVSSTASKIEEIGETNMVYMLLVIAGLYLNMPLWTAGFSCSDAYKNVMFLVPFTSAFIVPVYALFGQVSIGILLGCIAIQLVTIVLIGVFVANVYETLIMYTGSRVKFKQLFTIFKNNTTGGAAHE